MYFSKGEASKKKAKNSGRNSGRKRTKVTRKTKNRSL
jgi:hypothetical protein